jgi:formylglycine-generating enzyme required for sulfatase activity
LEKLLFWRIFMKCLRFLAMLIIAATLAFIACDDDGGNSGSGGGGTAGDTVIDIAAIPGVTPPNYGETSVTTITETDQYTGTVSWSPLDATFAASTVYTATIMLTAKTGYTLTGVAENFFTVAGADTVSNDADSGVVTTEFPETGIEPPAVIDISVIPGITPPSYGETPVTAITETDQYAGTVSWNPSDITFAATTVYTATITLTAKSGYTLTGVTANFFTVAGATSDTNSANSGVVTAVFPATAAAVAESDFTGATEVGAVGSIIIGSETVDMIYANNQTSIIFPFSPTLTTPVDNNTATLTRKFFMSETNVTNALMVEVLQWAYNNGKFSVTVGDHNGLNSTTAKHGGQQLLDLADTYIKINYSGGSFTVDSGYEDHPVVCVTWYGAIIFCNWLTEMRDGNTTNVVYTGIDTTWDHTETVENADRIGYRLPSSEEWEYAARYIGTTAPTQGDLATEYVAKSHNSGHSTLTSGYYWTPADYASRAIRDYSNETETRAVAWYSGDPLMGGDKLMVVAQKTANQLGLCDMSGNVWEWCFTAREASRVRRGGSWGSTAHGLQVGLWSSIDPNYESYVIGFRFTRTQ